MSQIMIQFVKKFTKLDHSRDGIFELKNLAESIPESAKQIVEIIAKDFKQV